jgi:site-specific DNA recombinase
MTNISSFARFGKTSNVNANYNQIKTAVAYTRVSSKEQADKNLSLDFQLKAIQDNAARNNIAITQYFGGTYESAKTDGRKEFQRMLEYIKKNKGKITHILVYTLDRFSRTGGGAIKLAQELREKYGVEVYAVTQPTDTSNPSGVLQQSIHFIFSQYD